MHGSLKENLKKINDKISSELPNEKLKSEPLVIAVSKRQSSKKMRDLYQLGMRNFGENYLQEAKEKMEELKDLQISWHYIGQIQKKKVKDIVGRFEFIHSLDREDVAEKISAKCTELKIRQKVLLQVNIAGEESKQGLDPKEIFTFLNKMSELENIDICGLMVFPPLSQSDEDSLHWFREGYQLFQQVKEHLGESFQYLSMGTSQNYHLAVREGANMLRIGESLMGLRL